MKRLVFAVFLCLTFLVFAGSLCFAAEVTESPDIKIVIDGNIGTYSNVPVISDGRTLLPLRQVLVNLGVQNDDQHIIWDGASRTVTINKDSTVITLTVGKSEAKVDSSNVTLDVAPMIYKDRTYIPARFVAQSLGKKVVWDSRLKAVLIRDEKQYDDIKKIIDSVNSTMKSFDNYKIAGESEMTINGSSMDITSTSEVDVKKELIHVNQLVKSALQEAEQEFYISGDTMYMSIPNTGKWLKRPMTAEQLKENSMDVGGDDTVYSSLTIADNSDPDEIKLSGNINLPGYFVQDDGSAKLISKTFYTEIYIDKKTNTVKKVYTEISGDYTAIGQTLSCTLKTTSTYSDFNGDFKVTMPEDIDSNSVTA